MAQERLAMQKIKDVLRLHLAGGVTSRRQLARIVGCGKTAVSDCLRRAQVTGLTDWAVVAGSPPLLASAWCEFTGAWCVHRSMTDAIPK